LHASHPTPIRDYSNKLGAALQKQPHNMYNMHKKGSLLGVHNQSKVTVHHRHHPPVEKMDGSCQWITVVECTCTDNSMLSPLVIYKGKGLYCGWFTEVNDQNAKFVYSDNVLNQLPASFTPTDTTTTPPINPKAFSTLKTPQSQHELQQHTLDTTSLVLQSRILSPLKKGLQNFIS